MDSDIVSSCGGVKTVTIEVSLENLRIEIPGTGGKK